MLWSQSVSVDIKEVKIIQCVVFLVMCLLVKLLPVIIIILNVFDIYYYNQEQ